MADTQNFSSLLDTNNDAIQPIMDIITAIMEVPENLDDSAREVLKGMLQGAFPDSVKSKSITTILQAFKDEGLSRHEAGRAIESFKTELADFINTEIKPSDFKRELLNSVFDEFFGMFDSALERFSTFDIELPIKLDKGATMPTYAHDSDACADIYALEKVTIPAHSLSNKVRTGIYLGLPENWQARIAPRSSIGAKTPLRLSNAQGIIDPDYRGEVLILYDNISDSDYTIEAGDRIAQIWVEPVRRFKGIPVDILPATERNENGFGSTGK